MSVYTAVDTILVRNEAWEGWGVRPVEHLCPVENVPHILSGLPVVFPIDTGNFPIAFPVVFPIDNDNFPIVSRPTKKRDSPIPSRLKDRSHIRFPSRPHQ